MNSSLPIRLTGSVQIIEKDRWQLFDHQKRLLKPALTSKALILVGGGHSHALLLRLWTMRPELRPAQSITLVSSHGTALYSGMVPALIAGVEKREKASINLRWLAQQAGVSFMQATVEGIDTQQGGLQLLDRPELNFGFLSLNLGAVTRRQGLSKRHHHQAPRACSACNQCPGCACRPTQHRSFPLRRGWIGRRRDRPRTAPALAQTPSSPSHRRPTDTSIHGARAISSSNPAQRRTCPRRRQHPALHRQ